MLQSVCDQRQFEAGASNFHQIEKSRISLAQAELWPKINRPDN